jgi:galactarate dehydratase
MFSEVTEVRDAIHLLTPRAINEEVGKRLLEEMAWYDNYLDMGKTDRSANPPRATRKAAWRTSSRKRWALSPNPGRARLPKCSLRGSARPNAA